MKALSQAAVLFFLISSLAAVTSNFQAPAARDVVSPAAYASFDPVARGKGFQLAVVLKIRNGFHINARQPSADYLIPTNLRSDLPAGFQAGDISYPKGELLPFAFSKTPLNVYEDKAVIRMSLTALQTATLGLQHIPLKLRYQACSNEVCLPPVTLDLDAQVNVVAGAAEARPAHRELFLSQR